MSERGGKKARAMSERGGREEGRGEKVCRRTEESSGGDDRRVAESTSRPTRIMPLVWRRVAITAVAAIVALVIVNIASVRSYDEEQIGSMMAYFSNYDNYTVESAAANPIELLYGEDE